MPDIILSSAERPPNVLAAECPSRAVLKHLTSQWGVLVMLALQDGTLRFAALRRRVGGVSERMLAQIDECYQIIKPEMAMHYDRWAEQNLKSISFDQPQTKDGCLRYWESRVERLRNVARKRPAYCWRQVAEYFKLTDAQGRVTHRQGRP